MNKRKLYKDIIKELGSRSISLEAISNDLDPKHKGFLDVADQANLSLDEILMLTQYAKAITEGDTKAAAFIRDTAGQKPVEDVKITSSSQSFFDSLSMDELEALKKSIAKESKK